MLDRRQQKDPSTGPSDKGLTWHARDFSQKRCVGKHTHTHKPLCGREYRTQKARSLAPHDRSVSRWHIELLRCCAAGRPLLGVGGHHGAFGGAADFSPGASAAASIRGWVPRTTAFTDPCAFYRVGSWINNFFWPGVELVVELFGLPCIYYL